MIAEIIAAGSEMLTPFRQDTNSLYLTAQLNELGVQVAFKTIVGDNLAHLTDAAKTAIARADVEHATPPLLDLLDLENEPEMTQHQLQGFACARG